MKILLTGRRGQIGSELVRAWAGEPSLDAAGRDRLDLARPDEIRRVVRACAPDLVVNAAGETDVDGAEMDPARAEAVNARGAGILAEEAARAGAALIHFSTDYVFDGRKGAPYDRADEPNPISAYGASKLEGERAVAAAGGSFLILRLSWVYSTTRPNFVTSILHAASVRSELRVVTDQRGSPTWSRTVALSTRSIVDRALVRGVRAWSFGGLEGIWHLACRGEASRFELAQRAVEHAGVDPAPTIVPISTAEYSRPARRPACSSLDSTATERAFSIELPRWADALGEALAPCRAQAPVPGCQRRIAG